MIYLSPGFREPPHYQRNPTTMDKVRLYKGTDWPVRSWTKDEIVKLIKIWPTMDMETLSKEFKRPMLNIAYVAAQCRRNGVDLPKKKWVQPNGIAKLVKEVVEGK